MKKKKAVVKNILEQEWNIKEEETLLENLTEEPIILDVDKEENKNLTRADKVVDIIANLIGSWKFIIGFSLFLLLWILLNLFVIQIDPYPFILLNLFLSCIAAIQAPIVMMSQSRNSKRDSLRNQNDFRVDLKSELIIEDIYHKMNKILANQELLLRKQESKKQK